MGRASGRKRAKQQAARGHSLTGFPGNPWDQATGVDGTNPHAVLAACQDRLAQLHGLKQKIHHDDRQLHAAAGAMQDHHAATADRLGAEIRQLGVGADPLLEDAHAAHLAERRTAEEVALTLKKRIDAHDPRP